MPPRARARRGRGPPKARTARASSVHLDRAIYFVGERERGHEADGAREEEKAPVGGWVGAVEMR